MFLKLFIFSFLSLPLKNVRIEQTDVDFNNALNSVVTTVGAIGYFVPKLLRNNEICSRTSRKVHFSTSWDISFSTDFY